MVERGILYFIVYLFLLHGLVKGFEVRGHNGNKGHQTLTEKPCVSIVVTDSETYKGTVYLIYLFNIFIVSYFNYLSEEGTSTLRFKNVRELLKLRDGILFSSILASSLCLMTIIETNSDDGILEIIDMVNDFRVDTKHLSLKVSNFNENMLGNITINYDVTIEHRAKGKVN